MNDTLRTKAMAELREAMITMRMLGETTPSRELSLALTNVQQGYHWLREAPENTQH